jgi:hypothetical protein
MRHSPYSSLQSYARRAGGEFCTSPAPSFSTLIIFALKVLGSLYSENGPPIEIADRIAWSMPTNAGEGAFGLVLILRRSRVPIHIVPAQNLQSV